MGLAKKAFVNHFAFVRYEHSSGYVLGAAIPIYPAHTKC